MTALSLLPPLVAIVVVLWKRQVIMALLLALLCAELLIAISPNSTGFANNQTLLLPLSTVINSLERIISVLASPDNLRIVMFSLLVGALLLLMQNSGGVNAMVRAVIKLGLARGRRSTTLVTAFMGIVLFIESNISLLSAGIFARGLFAKYAMSKERLAYIIDSTCSPVCVLILFNAWGAYFYGLIADTGIANPMAVLWGTVPYNFYAISTIAIVFYTALSDKLYGPLAKTEIDIGQKTQPTNTLSTGKLRYMALPFLVLLTGIFAFMLITGNGQLSSGDAAKSVLYSTALALLSLYAVILKDRLYSADKLAKQSLQGMAQLLPVVSILVLSIAFGRSVRELGLGEFIAAAIGGYLPLYLITPSVFVVSAIIAFAIGTSWGTFALMMPIAAAFIGSTELPPSFVISAIIGGAVFGDHTSPISDSTVMASLASGSEVLAHVQTQLPYALVAALITMVLYVMVGLTLLA